MSKADYWPSLEFRLSREFAGLSEGRYRNFWCDGFSPSNYVLDGPSPRITGMCSICQEDEQVEWTFALLLPRLVASREQIDWRSLLPPENTTRWMGFDERRRYIEIDPAAAVPDVSP
jgi:hypothetical protein